MCRFLSSNLLFGCLEPKFNFCLPNHCTTFCLTAKQVFPPTAMNVHNNERKKWWKDCLIAKNRNLVRLNGSMEMRNIEERRKTDLWRICLCALKTVFKWWNMLLLQIEMGWKYLHFPRKITQNSFDSPFAVAYVRWSWFFVLIGHSRLDSVLQYVH